MATPIMAIDFMNDKNLAPLRVPLKYRYAM